MAIAVQSVVTLMASALDAEGSDRYTFDQDYRPSINYAIEWLVTAFNQAFAENKVSPENLRELVKVKVWQANAFSRVAYNPAIVGHELWTIISVYPTPVLNKITGFPALADPAKSVFMPNASYVSGKSASRLTLEEWNDGELNVFMPGNTVMQNQLKEYAYLDFADYSSNSYVNPVPFEIEVRPAVGGKFVAIAYVKQPDQIALITDSLEFPVSMRTLIVNRALNWIANKQGDNTSLYQVSDKDIKQLIGLMS